MIEQDALFPTLVYRSDFENADSLNAHLKNAIEAERLADQTGLARSNDPESGGWHSRDTLHRDGAFTEIAYQVRRVMGEIASDLDYHPSSRPGIRGMWAIVNKPGASNRAHIHPGALWSGVYYVAAPERAGDIVFTDPRTAQLMRQPRYSKRPDICRGEVSYTPRPGLLLMFPGWLYHEVGRNRSDTDRIIISFNLA